MDPGARPDTGGRDRARRSGSRRAAIPVEGRERTLIVPGASPSGQPILSVLLKRTYRIEREGRTIRTRTDQPFHPADVYHGEPFLSSLALESDVVAFKPATDVVLTGRVYAPDGEPVEMLHASLTVGGLGKELLVVGDRVCHYQGDYDPVFEDPVRFTAIDLRYEHAYGGIDAVFDPTGVYAYPRNPVGRGFVVDACEAAIEGLLLPNIEDPNDPLTPERLVVGAFEHWEQQPMPQGFGWYAKHWQPRIALAGVMPDPPQAPDGSQPVHAGDADQPEYDALQDAEQAEAEAPPTLPYMDFDFFNGASPGLVFPYLGGDELVEAIHLTPAGELRFSLPGETPRIGLDVGEGVWEPPVVLQTVMIRLDQREVDLVWRAAVAYAGPAWLDRVHRFTVLVE
jgi:hypothetical protein